MALVGVAVGGGRQVEAADPERTVGNASSVLNEIMAIPLQQIPGNLLAEAEAVAIFPGLIKVGFIGGIEHGQGVVLIRAEDRSWAAPRLISITGGSIGWQIGASATDLILVFQTRKSVDNLVNGKFKIGVDVAAAAGPVGRRAEAATDGKLQAEIYSYSRSRGLFAGASIDGAVIQTNPDADALFYRTGFDGKPTQMPQSATRLLELVNHYTGGGGVAAQGQPAATTNLSPSPRAQLATSSGQLTPLLDENWRRYLALPAEVYVAGKDADPGTLAAVIERFNRTAADPQYQALTRRPEFQRAHQDLKRYYSSLESAAAKVALPPPPAMKR
jgi:lipid-binding SYLF domain-containing protein